MNRIEILSVYFNGFLCRRRRQLLQSDAAHRRAAPPILDSNFSSCFAFVRSSVQSACHFFRVVDEYIYVLHTLDCGFGYADVCVCDTYSNGHCILHSVFNTQLTSYLAIWMLSIELEIDIDIEDDFTHTTSLHQVKSTRVFPPIFHVKNQMMARLNVIYVLFCAFFFSFSLNWKFCRFDLAMFYLFRRVR